MFMDAHLTNFVPVWSRQGERNSCALLTQSTNLISGRGWGKYECPSHNQQAARTCQTALSTYQSGILRKIQVEVRENRELRLYRVRQQW